MEAERAARAALAAGSKSFALAGKLLPRGVPRRRGRAVRLVPPLRRRHRPGAARRNGRRRCGGCASSWTPSTRARPIADPALAAFAEVVRRCNIPRRYPSELLDGFQMDVDGVRYGTVAELLGYAYRVAGTVGVMMAHLLGASGAEPLRRAAHLGIAMQLTNICRDVDEDWRNGRLYLPEELLGAAPMPSREVALNPAVAAGAIARLLARAEAILRIGRGRAGRAAVSLRRRHPRRAADLRRHRPGDRRERARHPARARGGVARAKAVAGRARVSSAGGRAAGAAACSGPCPRCCRDARADGGARLRRSHPRVRAGRLGRLPGVGRRHAAAGRRDRRVPGGGPARGRRVPGRGLPGAAGRRRVHRRHRRRHDWTPDSVQRGPSGRRSAGPPHHHRRGRGQLHPAVRGLSASQAGRRSRGGADGRLLRLQPGRRDHALAPLPHAPLGRRRDVEPRLHPDRSRHDDGRLVGASTCSGTRASASRCARWG